MSDSPRKEKDTTLSPRKKKKEEKKEKKKEKRKGESSIRKKGEGDEAEYPALSEGTTGLLVDLDFDDGGKVNKVAAVLKDCPIQNVTVYNDRAEVTRTVFATIAAGKNELSISGLSSQVDSNSVRVAGGKGAAVILEVSHNTRWEPKNKDDGTERGRLEGEREELDEKIARVSEALGRINKENTWLERWAQTISEPKKAVEGGKEESFPLFSSGMMEQALGFLEFYQKRLGEIDERRSRASKDLKELTEQKERVTRALNAMSSGNNEQVNEVIVLLTAQAETKVELVLSYIVMGASWHAAYDVRVQSNSDELSLTYYGFIVNSSYDDWTEAPLSLSTAKPSVGGAPPELTTKFVGFRTYDYNSMPGSAWSHGAVLNRAVMANEMVSMPQQQQQLWRAEEKEEEGGSGVYSRRAQDMQVLTSNVQESSISTSFTIPRKTTILSDNKPHKVTIRIIKLTAKYTYVIIPKLSTHAYLKASILNTSENYPFLPGEINVFMDGNFVAKSHIKAVSPNESFALFLGIDDSIKVTYPPGVLFKETQGLLKKSNLRTTKHTITVKNTKSKEISVTVFDQLPKSNDGQIKVRLLKPNVEGNTTEASLTEANNLKWKRDIAAGKEIKLPFEYQIEWPHGQELTM